MTSTQEQLLSLLSHVLFRTSTTAALTPEIAEEAQLQTVSTLIDNDYRTLGSNIRVINAHAELSSILSGIPFTTFKGYASASYYPVPVKRPMGDVDFIVDLGYYDAAVERLKAAGWKKLNAPHDRHVSFKKDSVEIELHTEIKGIPNGLDGISTSSATAEQKVRGLLADLIRTSRSVDTQQGPVIIPDDFHHGLIMLMHVAGHLINDGGVGLRHLCDWAVYVDHVDMDRYRPQIESVGLWTFACLLTAVCSKYLGLKKMNWAGEWPEAFLESLIEDVLAAGNFGKKEAGRRATLALHHSSFAEMTRKRYPVAEHIPLLPIFMVVNLARYGWLILAGKRRFIKPSTIKTAKDRDELYKQFRLFET